MKILVIDEEAEEYRTLLADLDHDIEFATTTPANPTCDILLASPHEAAAAINAGCEPKWIQSTWAGVDALLPAIKDKDIQLTGIKGIFGPLMSEYIFAYILADLRDIDHYREQQHTSTWAAFKHPPTLTGQTMLIVGTGSIGKHLATTARHFGMKTIGVNRTGAQHDEFDQITTNLDSVVGEADYVIGCLPETPSTRKIFDGNCFSRMKQSATFFNVGRGSSVDDEALVEALDRDQIRKAVLDVFEEEPVTEAHPFWATPNVVVTPHVSAPSHPKDIAGIFLENLSLHESGESLKFVIDVQTGY
jgi:phosphoglycerate dehydrogenase-like enzyme